MFCKKGVLKNFTDLRPATLFKKKLWHRCFLVNFVKFLRTPISIEHFCWLLLNKVRSFTWNTIEKWSASYLFSNSFKARVHLDFFHIATNILHEIRSSLTAVFKQLFRGAAQVGNQKFFRAGEVSWNWGTSINILSKSQEKGPAGKNLGVFLLDTLKTTFWMANLT